MTKELSTWLALREPADTAARARLLAMVMGEWFPRDRPLHILDLGTGTGANVRYLAGYMPEPQHWLLVDLDPALVAEAAERLSSWSAFQWFECHIEARELELGAFDHPEIFDGRQIVTASALLDLVSEEWLRSLAARCREVGAAALFALTYTGRFTCSPPEPEDDEVRDLFNRHQMGSDKGFGTAVGPDAVSNAARCFAAEGYYLQREPSDWVLRAGAHDELQRRLIEGWAAAATEVAPKKAARISDWRKRRLAHVDDSQSYIIVCHEDLAAWPTADQA